VQLHLGNNYKNFNKRYEYIVRTLLDIIGISYENDISIYFGENVSEDYDICIIANPNCQLNTLNSDNIIEEDIISKAFYLISCQEEYESSKDCKGRFLASYSNNDFRKPLVNYYALRLKLALEQAANKKGITLKKRDRSFTVVLSHDVDNITDKNSYVFLHRSLECVKLFMKGKIKESLQKSLHAVKQLFNDYNPYWCFEEYMQIEESYGFRSSFYFINGDKGRYGARYELDRVQNIIEKLDKLGWEVGLHTNYFSYKNARKIRNEKETIEKILGKEVLGCRNHYLRFEVPKTWRTIKEAGLKYDTTLGYADSIGFRGGIAYPFYPYDLKEEEIIDILEIPMVIMDGSALSSEGDIKQCWGKIQAILDVVREVNGTIAINFHQRVLYNEEFPGWKDIYINILDYIRSYEGRGIDARTLYNEFLNEKDDFS